MKQPFAYGCTTCISMEFFLCEKRISGSYRTVSIYSFQVKCSVLPFFFFFCAAKQPTNLCINCFPIASVSEGKCSLLKLGTAVYMELHGIPVRCSDSFLGLCNITAIKDLKVQYRFSPSTQRTVFVYCLPALCIAFRLKIGIGILTMSNAPDNELLGIFTPMPLCRSSVRFHGTPCLENAEAFRQVGSPGRWKPQSSLNMTTVSLPSLTSRSKYIYIYECKILCLAVAADFLTNPFISPFISLYFLLTSGVWTQTGIPCLGRSSYMCWQQSCRTSFSRFPSTGFKASSCRADPYTFDPLAHQ